MIKINVDLLTTIEDFFERALCINQNLALIKEGEPKKDTSKGKKINQGKKKKRNYPTFKKAACRNNNKNGRFAQFGTNKLHMDTNNFQIPRKQWTKHSK